MRRFLFFSLPLLVLTMGLFRFAQELTGFDPDPAALAPAGAPALPAWVTLGTWILEAVGLAALFLLVHARGGGRFTAGLLTAWIAWIFRGPLLVVAATGLGGLPPGPWWSLAFSWWILYTICGLVLAGIAAATGLSA